MKYKSLFLIFFLILSFISLPPVPAKQSPIVFCEEGTATWCTKCPKTAHALHNIYESGDYAFYYVALVSDKNPKAKTRLEEGYNIKYYTTTYFDGGYQLVIGGIEDEEPYRTAILESRARERADVEMSLSVSWQKQGNIGITLSIKNDENAAYEGNLKAYVVEPTSRWNDHDKNPYHFGFLDFAFNEDITIQKGGQIQKSGIWNASNAGYPDVSRDNIMVIVTLFSKEMHTGYSDPPSGNPFDAHYIDAVAAAEPPEDSPPETNILMKPPLIIGYRNAIFSWTGSDDFTSETDILYSYTLIGYDATWSPWSSTQEIAYENLPDGIYTFKVKSKDNEGQEDESPASWTFTIDTSPPTVVSTKPKHNSINVGAYASISIIFSFDMDKESVENAIEIMPQSTYKTQWNGEKEIFLIPKERWEYDTAYTITIQGGRRTSGQEMQEYTFSFETESEDTLPPKIISTTPRNEEKIKAGENIIITFSEPMDMLFFNKALYITPWIPHHITWETNDTVLHILPKEWKTGVYEIAVTTYASDRYGNRLEKNYTFTFEIISPFIVSTFPSNGEKGVSPNTNISLTFSEKMDTTSVEKFLAIQPEMPLTLKWEGNTFILNPSNNLEYGKEYIITIAKNAKSSHNISLGNEYTLSFSTEEKIPERVIEETPSFTVMFAILAILLILLKKLK